MNEKIARLTDSTLLAMLYVNVTLRMLLNMKEELRWRNLDIESRKNESKSHPEVHEWTEVKNVFFRGTFDFGMSAKLRVLMFREPGREWSVVQIEVTKWDATQCEHRVITSIYQKKQVDEFFARSREGP